jgi:hypothetical protein
MDFSKLTMKTMVRYMKSHEGIRRVSEGLKPARKLDQREESRSL